jgi:hypothetical protein
MNALLDAALGFAKRDLKLFPLHYIVDDHRQLRCSCGNAECGNNSGKHPYPRLAPRGLFNATSDAAILTRWWGAGVPYNIGLRTGKASCIVVIDVDPRHSGDETLAELERRFGALPLTWRFLTGGGGEHVLFRHPGRDVANSVETKRGPGLDVRGDGGYIVAPPSRHLSGRCYEISVDHHPDEVPLADMPAWLAQMVSASPKPNATAAAMPESWRKLVAEGVAEGQRNIAVTRLSGHLLRRDIDPLVVLDLLRCWNALRCRPPLSDAEIERTVDSICGLELARRERGNGTP